MRRTSSYREFLEGMKQDMEGIRYDIRHTTADEDSVVFSMDVCITKADGSARHRHAAHAF
jgi:hypothetical protein